LLSQQAASRHDTDSLNRAGSTKGLSMTSHMTISPQEAADRLAIRELIDAYAHCADQRDARGQMALSPPTPAS